MTQEDIVKQWIKECIYECLNDYSNHFNFILDQKVKEIQNSHKPNQWLFTNDVQNILKLSPRTIKRLRKANAIPFVKIGKTCFYPSIYFEKILLDNLKKKYSDLFDE